MSPIDFWIGLEIKKAPPMELEGLIDNIYMLGPAIEP